MSKPTAISTIRHAYTDYNAQRRYAGTIDVSLSETGVAEARGAVKRLRQLPLDVVISSPLKRAVETARIFAGDTTPLVINELCTERNFGMLEGLTWDDVRRVQPPVLLIQVGFDLHTVNPKGGEAFEDVWQRAREFRKFLFANYEGRNSLVVSHGVFLQLFNGLLRGLNCIESLGVFPGNLELNRFQFTDGRLVNDTVTRLGHEEMVSW
jgi:broad specificity phosphatase PhoE